MIARRRLLGLLRRFRGRICERPFIVLGNQKSGTSVIAHLLADFGGLTKTIDIPPLWGRQGAEIILGRLPLRTIVEGHRRYFASELLKEPMMTFFPAQVLEVFPAARVVFLVRDPRDNIRSLLNRRGLPGHLEALEPGHLPPDSVLASPELWGGEEENYIGVLSHRWNKALDGYFRFEDRMLLVRYEDFLENKLAFIAGLAHRLRIPERGDISRRLDVPYQPPGDRSTSPSAFFGARNLAAIHRICGDRMARVGYRTDEAPAAG